MPPLCVWQVVRVILRAPNAPRCREYEIRQVHEGWRLQFAIFVYCGDTARHFVNSKVFTLAVIFNNSQTAILFSTSRTGVFPDYPFRAALHLVIFTTRMRRVQDGRESGYFALFSRRPVVHGLLRCLIHLFRGHQYMRLQLYCPTLVDCQTEGRRSHRIRHIDMRNTSDVPNA
jgi:hypothetical protein